MAETPQATKDYFRELGRKQAEEDWKRDPEWAAQRHREVMQLLRQMRREREARQAAERVED
jgi:hypothetical protein